MPLQKAITTDTQISVPNAYHRITGLTWYGGGELGLQVGIWATKAARNGGAPAITTVSYSMPIDTSTATGNWLANAYTYLKTLPDFSGAIDVT